MYLTKYLHWPHVNVSVKKKTKQNSSIHINVESSKMQM
jgi:hypothetical protein